MQDSAHILQEQVRDAARDGTPLVIKGGNSKSFYGIPIVGEPLNTVIHSGIVEYEPTELTITVRAGTALKEVNEHLAAQKQMLAFEPPEFSDVSTFGGIIAAGLSGPSRPYRASLSDSILGCRILNGRGEILEYGGKVMKNVAGYDLSRLMSGSLGCLGVILDATLKVIPRPESETTAWFSVQRNESVAFLNELRKKGYPVSASAYIDEELVVRFSASSMEIAHIPELLKTNFAFIPHRTEPDSPQWMQLANHAMAFFDIKNDEPKHLWRLSVSPGQEIDALLDQQSDLLTEWGGAMHWVKSDKEPGVFHALAADINAQATLFKANDRKADQRFTPLSPVLNHWYAGLKSAFDPEGILNPGKMYSDF